LNPCSFQGAFAREYGDFVTWILTLLLGISASKKIGLSEAVMSCFRANHGKRSRFALEILS